MTGRFVRRTAAVVVAAGALAPLHASPAVAEDVRGKRCQGAAVVSCMQLDFTDVSTFRAHSWITDSTGDTVNYQVRSTDVVLQVWNGTDWVAMAGTASADADGWFDASDSAVSPAGNAKACSGFLRVRARAHSWWTTDTVQGQWVDSLPVDVPCASS